MVLIEQSVSLIKPEPGQEVSLIKACEYAARNCYASQDKITDDSYIRFCKSLITRGHEAPLEFASMMFDITTSRAVLAEITRHRLASFCVESQRYIQEAQTGDISFILPVWYDQPPLNDESQNKYWVMSQVWRYSMENAENAYKTLIAQGAKPEEAREVLPNSTACRIIMNANLREWRNIFKLRCDKAAYPQMRVLALEMLRLAHEHIPVVFDDLFDQYQTAFAHD